MSIVYRMRNVVLWLLLVTSFCFTGVVLAQSPSNQALLQRAEAEGSLRVIVNLNTAFTPEGNLPSVAAAGLQRAAIASAQGRIISALNSNLARVTRRYETVPHLALEASAGMLADLVLLDDVLSIEEDLPVPPIMSSSNSVIGSPDAWANGYTGAAQAVAILDTGVDKTHPYFSTGGDKVVSEACYSSNYSSSSVQSISVCPGGPSSVPVPMDASPTRTPRRS